MCGIFGVINTNEKIDESRVLAKEINEIFLRNKLFGKSFNNEKNKKMNVIHFNRKPSKYGNYSIEGFYTQLQNTKI